MPPNFFQHKSKGNPSIELCRPGIIEHAPCTTRSRRPRIADTTGVCTLDSLKTDGDEAAAEGGTTPRGCSQDRTDRRRNTVAESSSSGESPPLSSIADLDPHSARRQRNPH